MTKSDTSENRHPRICAWIFFSVLTIYGEQFARAEEPLPSKAIFELIKGHGIDVCEAYLQRLNATEFLDNNPVKGRISEPQLEGFIDLKPVPLTAEEIQRINYKTISFDRYQDQNLIEKLSNKQNEYRTNVGGLLEDAPKGVRGLPANSLEAINANILVNKRTPFVRYQTQLDLDNDGIADDVVIKNKQGVYIVDPSMQQIIEDRMKRIFADQEALDWPSLISFPVLVFPINVFGYKGKYYFDGFFTNLSISRGYGAYLTSSLSEPYYFGVYMHDRNQNNRICEYQVFGMYVLLTH